MNKPSQYIPLWKKIEREKIVTVETTVPGRVKKAIMNRKLVAQAGGRLKFRTELLVPDNYHGQDPKYLLHIAYTLPRSSGVSKNV
jgi:hypothetical protein